MEDELPPAKRDNRLRTCLDAALSSPVPPNSCTGNLHWSKRCLAFRPYTPPKNFNKRPSLPFIFKKSPMVKLTKDISLTYKICNPQFWYSEELNPKRYLTIPSEGVLNNGHDNANSDLIISANYILINMDAQKRYVVKNILGHGTFGQVAKCFIEESNTFVAVKIIKNEPAYYQQALVEVSILASLNKKYDPDDQHHIVRIFDYFVHHNHLCISFELLDMNLYSLIKINSFRGLSLNIVQLFSKQILMGLRLMKDVGIIHCDLKPENILLCTSDKPDNIKIIDFGSACLEDHTVYSYIQSRYYRSPEVILGYQYTTAIDMWSFGCIVAELFLGLPLFPGASEFDLLRRMIKIRGGHPPDHVLKEAKNTSKYFKFLGSVCFVDSGISVGCRSSFRALTLEEFEMRELKKPLIGKEYFNHMNIDEIVKNYPYGKLLPEQDIAKESQTRLALIDFLKGLVEFDPAKRWSPFQASQHPFVTGEPFTCPYNPPLRTPHIVVSQSIKIHHHPGGGHWLAAGISPGMAGRKWGLNHNSPFVQMIPHGHANNFGSLGSHSSYGDSMIGTSYGSYGDYNDISAYFSPVGPGIRGIRDRGSVLGTSPDSKARFSYQQPCGNGNVSPSASGFSPLALGSSPSWFTPPQAYHHISAGSPGNYDPCSPKGGSCYGIPLGKTARTNPFSRRKSLGPNGPAQKYPEMPFFSTGQGNFTDDTCMTAERVCHLAPSPIPLWQSNSVKKSLKEQQGYVDVTSSVPTQLSPGFYSTSSSRSQNRQVLLHREDTGASESMPTPSDWDPNYSDDLLLQDDSLEVDSLSSDFNMGLVIPQTLAHGKMADGIRRPPYTSFNRSHIHEKSNSACMSSNLPQSHVSQTRYMASLSKSSNLNPGKTTIPPGMHWNHMHFHSPSQLLAGHKVGNSELPRSPPHGSNGCGRIV